jgi:hypothetical protein
MTTEKQIEANRRNGRMISSAWRLKRLVRSERIQLHVGTYKPHGSQETLEMVDYRSKCFTGCCG